MNEQMPERDRRTLELADEMSEHDHHGRFSAAARARQTLVAHLRAQASDEPSGAGPHKSHDIRDSDASSFDSICNNCGATDVAGGGWGKLADPCPKPSGAERAEPVRIWLNRGAVNDALNPTPQRPKTWPYAYDDAQLPDDIEVLYKPGKTLTSGLHIEAYAAAPSREPEPAPSYDIVTRLRNTPNWMRESYGSWKDCVLKYDRAPFEAADEIVRLLHELPAKFKEGYNAALAQADEARGEPAQARELSDEELLKRAWLEVGPFYDDARTLKLLRWAIALHQARGGTK